MYLHNDKEGFAAFVNLSAERTNIAAQIIEKDYYVSMILRFLSQKMPFVVFKGGTSLSKCYKAIKRFSEDIDITIDTLLSQGQKKKLKYALVEAAEELGLCILNLDDTRSRRDYNQYKMEYKSIFEMEDIPIASTVLVETSFTAVAFPMVMMPVTSYVGEAVMAEKPEILEEYGLESFDMKVQGIERTLADKVFAICDYYLQKRMKRYSRHIYDIYKILPLVEMNDDFKNLVNEVREVRKRSSICPSAQDGVDIPSLLQTIIEQKVYKEDYQNVTEALLEEEVSYDTAILAVEQIRASGMFGKE